MKESRGSGQRHIDSDRGGPSLRARGTRTRAKARRDETHERSSSGPFRRRQHEAGGGVRKLRLGWRGLSWPAGADCQEMPESW